MIMILMMILLILFIIRRMLPVAHDAVLHHAVTRFVVEVVHRCAIL